MNIAMKGIVLVLQAVVVVVMSGHVYKCLEIIALNSNCCNYIKSEENLNIARKCYYAAQEPRPCAFEMCYGKERGFVRSNGTIDKNLLIQSVEKDFENYTAVYDVIKGECFAEDLSHFQQEEPCYLRELGNCFHFYAMVNCPNWVESDECTRAKETIQECAEFVS